MQSLPLALVLASSFTLVGCAKHSDGCKKSVDLKGPFAELGLPTEEGNGRVCEADGKKIKVEHSGADQDRWREKYEEAIVGHGYTKKDCSKTQCVYVKGKARIRVNILELAKKWTTVIVEDYPEK